jgi:hypothetical protein
VAEFKIFNQTYQMNKFTFVIIITISLFSQIAMAQRPPDSKAKYCQRFNNSPIDSSAVLDMSSDDQNLMAFKNDGGLFNGGVCWWHARFQRNILYIAIFKPNLPKASSPDEMKSIIHQIRLGNSVVSINGYKHLFEFSSENHKLIQNELNDWQLYDGVVLGGWMDGIKGSTSIPADELKDKMEEVYNYVAVQKKIAYEKLQIKGITSHAWLIDGIKKSNNGFDLGIIDSNEPRMTLPYSYKFGDESFSVSGYGNFVPYLEFTREEARLINTGKSYCGVPSLIQSELNSQAEYQADLDDLTNH